ncbi:MAG: 4-(cytidine 5'-diphospho)-2-C-methyl-D-erythritol kinase [Oscillospiraceae bacterium]|nr:4-(cytidine 5'-diphospho)-2-C-methyl-D-erythritol kinase [Oscillospiraceae bacterium]
MKKTVKAYGKLNLALDITGKLANGYHTICTVMQSVSLCNIITVTANKSGKITLSSDDKALPTDSGNTAYRAAALFLEQADTDKAVGLDIFIEKRVPYQAGMGSASADAAGVLRAVNAIFNDPLSENELSKLALKVGADVPFCLAGGTALAEGIGEKLTALAPLADCAFLILHPNKGMSTVEAYKKFDSVTEPLPLHGKDCADAVNSGDLKQISSHCENMFERCCDIEDVFEIKASLKNSGALAACMTGSGTAVFGIFENMAAADRAQQKISNPKWRSWTAVPVNRGTEIE